MPPFHTRPAPRTAARLFGLVLAIGLPSAAGAQPAKSADEGFTQHGAHVHGQATLDLAVDGGTVTLALTTPAINVLGFERAPRTDAERRQVAEAEALLRAHARLFAFPVTARCTAGAASVTAPDWAAAAGGGKAKGEHAKGGAKDAHDHGHSHDHGHDHAHDHDHAHADYVARWTFTCAQPSQLVFVDAPLVDRLAAGTVVATNVVTDAVQTRQELKSGAVRIRLR